MFLHTLVHFARFFQVWLEHKTPVDICFFNFQLTPENSQPCQNCGIPLCKNISQCIHRDVHLDLECKTFTHEASSASGVVAAELTKSIDFRLIDPHPFYQCIAPLRGILLKETDPEKWATIQVQWLHARPSHCFTMGCPSLNKIRSGPRIVIRRIFWVNAVPARKM